MLVQYDGVGGRRNSTLLCKDNRVLEVEEDWNADAVPRSSFARRRHWRSRSSRQGSVASQLNVEAGCGGGLTLTIALHICSYNCVY